ncbi:MAG: Sec-independent protein translocase protein TatB [Shinella sp.]|nr:Sec-independent protein translocase protein TatB [Shinella sp.]
MLEVGWSEILVIAIVLILVVGPKDLPPMLRAFGRMTSKMRGMASEFRTQFDEALREADLDDVRKTINDAQSLNPMNTIREAVNPLRQMGSEIKSDLQKTVSSASSPQASTLSQPEAGPVDMTAPGAVAGTAEQEAPAPVAVQAPAAATPPAPVKAEAAASGSGLVAAEPVKGTKVKRTAAKSAKPAKAAPAGETADVSKTAAAKTGTRSARSKAKADNVKVNAARTTARKTKKDQV